MGAGYSRACHSRPSPPTVYTLNRNGTIVPQASGKRSFNNAPIIKVEKLRSGNGFRNTCRKILARWSFSPGWIRYERLLRSISELSHAVFSSAEESKLELHITSPVRPLGMNIGDKIKERDLRRYEVSASLQMVQNGGVGGRGKPANSVLLDFRSTGETTGNTRMSPTQMQTQMQMQAQDWRRFDSRSITLEAQLRALEAVERYLLGRRDQILMEAVEALKLGRLTDGGGEGEEEEEEEEYTAVGDGGGEHDIEGVDLKRTVNEVGVRRRTGKR